MRRRRTLMTRPLVAGALLVSAGLALTDRGPGGTAASAPVPAAAEHAADAGTACDPDGVRTSYVIDGAAVVAVVVSGIDTACEGQVVSVVVNGTPGDGTVAGPATTVPISPPVPAASVETVGVAIIPPGSVRPPRSES